MMNLFTQQARLGLFLAVTRCPENKKKCESWVPMAQHPLYYCLLAKASHEVSLGSKLEDIDPSFDGKDRKIPLSVAGEEHEDSIHNRSI